MVTDYDLSDVLREADYIEAQRRINYGYVFETNGLLQTWRDRGTSTQIAYEMLGRWYAGDRSLSYHDVVVQELEQDMVPMSEIVEREVEIPHEYRFYAGKILADLTAKMRDSSEKGSTGMQLLNFLKNQEERLKNGEYRRPGEVRRNE